MPDKMFVISCDDGAEAQMVAKLASDALTMAEDLAGQGWRDVRITTPEGETYPLKAFARRLQDGLVCRGGRSVAFPHPDDDVPPLRAANGRCSRCRFLPAFSVVVAGLLSRIGNCGPAPATPIERVGETPNFAYPHLR
jgi:hypothetical protein